MTLAQSAMLEEIACWNEEKCRQELHSTLPKLVSIYHNAVSWNEHFSVLKILTKMFLPHLHVSRFEEEFFSKILPKLVKMFDDLMSELSLKASGLSSQNLELRTALRQTLQTVINIIEIISQCVRHLCSSEETLIMEDIRSLPSCTLHVLKNTFQHCKESESAYNGHLSLVADLLQALFKEAFLLQKALMELLDRIFLEKASTDKEAVNMVTVIHSLLDICSVISNMDHALHANTWKFIVKQSVKHKSLLEEQLRHNDILGNLCEDLLFSFQSCLQLAEQMKQSNLSETDFTTEYKLFQKSVKLCRFFANTMVHYIKEFQPFLSKCCGRVHKLFLQIYSHFPPSLYAPALLDTHQNEINSIVIVALDPLITLMLTFTSFAEMVLSADQQICPDQLLSQCLLLVSILDKLPSLPEDKVDMWCRGSQFPEENVRFPIFQALFWSFQQCYCERAVPIYLPGVMVNEKPQNRVTLHHYVCVHLCAFVASLPSICFPALEKSLLSALLCLDAQTALLAADVWCFLARYGTAELCQHHVHILAQLVLQCPGECYQLIQLSSLLKRMMYFITVEHHVLFLEKFSPGDPGNLVLWQHISLKAFNMDLRKQAANDIMRSAVTVCTRWIEDRGVLQELELVNTALCAMWSVCRCCMDVIDEEILKSVTGHVGQLWMRMSVQQVPNQPCVQGTVHRLLLLSSALVQNLDPPIISQIVTFLSLLLPAHPPDETVLAILEFLESLGRIFVPQEIQVHVLPKLSDFFAFLLAEKSWILYQHVLEAFTYFAEVTRHEEVVPQSLTCEEMKSKVVDFLSKNIPLQENVDLRIKRLKSERSTLKTHLERNTLEAAHEQPCSKRVRQETVEEEHYERAVQLVEDALSALESLLQQTPAPEWLAPRIKGLLDQITGMRSACSSAS
uniref:Fignl1 interacting regulator of recombination and mitosis n=1 Tax=Erpetoichthys calabaricus TaxID=27687 RepID=A0A8C4SPF4_ERPCA